MPPPRPGMPPPTPRALRQHFARHNARALGLAAASGAGAALLWGLLGLGAYWFTLLAATIARGTDPERSLEIFDAHDLVGPRFWPALAGSAAALVILALVARRGRWGDRLRDGRFYVFWGVLEVLLLAPNVLLAAWGNLRALVWVPAGDRHLAWALLQAVGAHQRAGDPLTLAGVAAEVGAAGPSRPSLNRALFALQLTGLVTLGEQTAGGWLLTLAGEEARALCGWPAARTETAEKEEAPANDGRNAPSTWISPGTCPGSAPPPGPGRP